MSLKDAVRVALDKNKSVEASTAADKAATSRVTEARAGFLPKVDYSESWTRSDNPVFVFSSLLTQHQFGEQNFQIDPLNRPGFLNNFQSRIAADQPLYDGGMTKHKVRSAELTKDMTGEESRRTQMEVIANTVRCYYDALLSEEQLKAATEAVRSAQADLDRAQTIRAAGMSTDADVLAIRVHLAGVEEQRIRRAADLDVARAALNDALGLPLDTAHALTSALTAMTLPAQALADYEKNAVGERPEAREAGFATSLAANDAAAARGNLRPQVDLHGAFEGDRQRFYDRGGANWLVSVELRWNLFNGFGDKARIEESQSALQASEATRDHAVSAIRLQVRRAFADLHAGEQRIEAAAAAVAEAEESLRITQNRYANGYSTVTDLLRTETAVLEAKTRHLAAIHDERIAAVALDLAAGTLTVESAVVSEGSR